MPNIIDGNGLQIKTVNEIIASLTAGMQAIYGSDINVDSNSPDGQLINIFAQAGIDNLELLLQVYNSFSVPTSFGTLLDQRVALNGLARKLGTYTTTPISITVNQALTLTGLDALILNPNAQVFTVADDAGNQFYLAVTHAFGGAGTTALTFRAVNIGQVQVSANTITNQVTTVLGVTNVNNPTVAGVVDGINEESDVQLKQRHDQSFFLASTGPADSISAALKAIPSASDAFVVENPTGADSGSPDFVPAHSVWCIVTGGTPSEIGHAIYAKKSPGCGMKGVQSFSVSRPNGNIFIAKWDGSIAQPLYIQFQILPRTAGVTFDNAVLAQKLADALQYKLGQSPNIGDIVLAMIEIAPNGILISVGVSTDNILFVDLVSPNTSQYYFTVSASNISIS